MTDRYFTYDYDEDFDYENQYDPYDYPARITVDSRDYCYTQHFDGHARIFDMGGDDSI